MIQLRYISSMLCGDDPIRTREIYTGCTPCEVARSFLCRKAQELYVGYK